MSGPIDGMGIHRRLNSPGLMYRCCPPRISAGWFETSCARRLGRAAAHGVVRCNLLLGACLLRTATPRKLITPASPPHPLLHCCPLGSVQRCKGPCLPREIDPAKALRTEKVELPFEQRRQFVISRGKENLPPAPQYDLAQVIKEGQRV